MNISQTTNRKNLALLLLLRTIAIIGQTLTIIFVNNYLEIPLPLSAMFSIIAILVLLNCLSFYRYKSAKIITDRSLFFELLFDVSAFALQIYFSGGATNPFISLFLLQVIIAAILLKNFYAWMIGIITIIFYVLLSFYFRHLHAFHDHDATHSFFSLHLQGMFFGYVFANLLLLFFINKIMKNLRERDEKINLMKKDALEKNQMIRTAMLATAAAHELGTPLATIAVILSDWKKMDLKNDLNSDISTIEKQLERCKKIISEILENSGKKRLEEAGEEDGKL